MPIAVEVGSDRPGHSTGDHHVGIYELDACPEAEIDIADITPAQDANRSIDRQGLVIHPPVQAHEIEGVAQGLQRPEDERVEEPDFHTGHGIERREIGVQAGDAVIVKQKADPHPALCGLPQFVKKKKPGRVPLPDIILHIDGAFRCADQGDPCHEGVRSIEQGKDSTLLVLLLRARECKPAEGCRLAGPHRLRDGSSIERRRTEDEMGDGNGGNS